MLDNAPNQLSKFKTKNCVEIANDLRITCNIGSLFKFKTSLLKLSFCYSSDGYILVKQTLIVTDTTAAADATNNTNQRVNIVIVKLCSIY